LGIIDEEMAAHERERAMRVLHYSTRLGRSGGGLHYSVSGLARAMAGLGVETMVAGGRGQRFEEERQVWGDLQLVTHPLGPGSYGFSAGMLAQITRLKPDILHIHGLWSASSLYGRFAPTETKVVVSPRGMLDPWILRRKSRIKHVHAKLLERPMLERAHLHALSDYEAETARSFFPGLTGRTFVLPNGLDAPGHSESIERKGALYLGRLHEKKQVLQLIDAWQEHKSRMDLTVAGWGAPALEAEVASRCAASKRTRFIGALHGAEKHWAFSEAEFFILPSLSEGLPMAALEALSHGCIPILTDACHLPELFSKEAALRIEADFSDFPGVLKRITRMDAREKAERARRARAASRDYHWPIIARSMLNHYSRILEEPS
jgi:glycosyltransferase involved in cell wall biosynthesis